MNLKIIKNTEVIGTNINIYGDYERPLFNANEIAKIIKNSNVSQMLKPVEAEEKELITMYGNNNVPYKQWYLTEEGLYEVLMLSRKPEAKEFKKKVKEILKSVRKHGGYIYVKASDNELEIRKRVESILEATKKEFLLLSDKVKEYETFFDTNREYITTKSLADIYEIPYEEFLEKLNEIGLIYKKGKILKLYREHKYKGYIKYQKVNGKYILKWTSKGEKYIFEKLSELKIER
ncbi:phage repressor protein [Leptotrichia sp. OH3620_COT-345]|uniref:BRO-N domain-containing protein n=1 Tax=Leptotrichia sp. OH3620_COT-345 TaxID=2491048 RepID=UPI000F64C901|nr:BRO family protein [Leptotrichia sp. OH3620_COT-345]RRD40380.1 phage repressor protein [Leptotrichia sp. OH3620_COT-345]